MDVRLALGWWTVAAGVCLMGAAPAPAQESARPKSPVLRLSLSSAFLHAAFAQPVNRVTPFAVLIDRYYVAGTGHLRGTMGVDPLPCADHARLRVTLGGQIVSADRVQDRSLQIVTEDRGRVCLEQEIDVRVSGISASPATVRAPTRSQLHYVETGKPPVRDLLIRGLARGRFRKTQANNDRIATAISEHVLNEELGRDSTATLDGANRVFLDAILAPLQELQMSPGDLHLASSAAAVSARLDLAGSYERTPPAVADGADLLVQLHQDLINRLLTQKFAGVIQDGKELERALERINRRLHLAALPSADQRPWSITLARQNPISVKFDGGQIEFVIHGTEYKIGTDSYPAMDITLRYTLTRTANGWRAVRQIPAVTTPGAKPGSGTSFDRKRLTLVLFLVRKFTELFAKEVDPAEIALAGPLLSVRGNVVESAAKDGWLLLEWRLAR